MPCAIITGTAGQDGSYLAEYLLKKGYHVIGMVRRNSSLMMLDRLKEPRKHSEFELYYGDVTDIASIMHLFQKALDHPSSIDTPLEVYNLAAQSHVKVSFDTPIYTAQSDAIGVLHILEVIRQMNITNRVRLYQASTSELYGSSPAPQSESTPFQPRSPYAIAKLYAYHIIKNYREAYGMYAVNGILFNHESERRGENFVSRKITRAVAQVYHQKTPSTPLCMGNIYAYRDWGHAEDYVDAMWKMLQQPRAQDFVIATGESHTVKSFIEMAFAEIRVPIRWEGMGVEEKGYHAHTNELLVTIDPKFFRQTEVHELCGDASKAAAELDWRPTVNFHQLVHRMVTHDIAEFTSSKNQE